MTGLASTTMPSCTWDDGVIRTLQDYLELAARVVRRFECAIQGALESECAQLAQHDCLQAGGIAERGRSRARPTASPPQSGFRSAGSPTPNDGKSWALPDREQRMTPRRSSLPTTWTSNSGLIWVMASARSRNAGIQVQ